MHSQQLRSARDLVELIIGAWLCTWLSTRPVTKKAVRSFRIPITRCVTYDSDLNYEHKKYFPLAKLNVLMISSLSLGPLARSNARRRLIHQLKALLLLFLVK